MNDTQRHTLLRLARETVFAAVQATASPRADSPASGVQHEGVFVTVRVGASLRGCMGNLDPSIPIEEAVRRAATLVVTSDRRFPALRPDELPRLTIELHVLRSFERITREDQVTPGIHGLLIEHLGRRGLLLPSVAIEHGMDAAAFLDAVCVKAGLPAHAWSDADATLSRFLDECINETS